MSKKDKKKANDVQYHRSCEKATRCTKDKCDAANCDAYKYNMKRYNTFNDEVEVAMSDEALVAVGAQLVEARDFIGVADEELASAKADHKKEVADHEKTINRCVAQMKSKTETIQVEVTTCEDHVNNVFTKSYIDENGEEVILDERELTENEVQAEMDLIAKGEETPEEDQQEPTEPSEGVTGELLEKAVEAITKNRVAKTATLQRELSISPELANEILDTLEKMGHLGAMTEDGEPREILFELPEEEDAPEEGDDKPQGEDN